jgi:G:T/U-mismatch repair DNA glycosylase
MCSGGTAAKLGMKVLGEQAARYRIFALPSSSPAHTLSYAAKLESWLALKRALGG